MLGVSDGIQDAYIITLLQRFVPDHVQGRMFGALTLIVGGIAGPVGLGVLMLLSVWLSITTLFIIAAIGMCVVTLLLIRYAFISLADPVLEVVS
jgi:MFS family permease